LENLRLAVGRQTTGDKVGLPRARERLMARKISTAIGLILVIVLGVLQVADAEAARTPEVRLNCEHGTVGCAGMAGDFSTADGSSVDSVEVLVTDVTTGAVIDVTSNGCEVSMRADIPHTVQVHCMIEGAAMGIDGDITWSVLLNGVTVWTSPVTPTQCERPATTTPPTAGGVTPPQSTTTTSTTTTTTTIAPEAPPPTTPPATTTTIAEEQPATDTTVATAVSSTTGPPADTTTTTVATLVSPAGSEPPGTDTVTEEILPVTGLSLGVIGAIGAILLLVGWAIERNTRRDGV
jgi:hypothetical protein